MVYLRLRNNQFALLMLTVSTAFVMPRLRISSLVVGGGGGGGGAVGAGAAATGAGLGRGRAGADSTGFGCSRPLNNCAIVRPGVFSTFISAPLRSTNWMRPSLLAS